MKQLLYHTLYIVLILIHLLSNSQVGGFLCQKHRTSSPLLASAPVLHATNSKRNVSGNGSYNEKKHHGSKAQDVGQQKEKTVVILYHKPKGVITSHSMNDALPSSSSSSDNQSAPKRCTVYDDIESMKGYINIVNPVASNVSTNASTNANKSFREVTGIKSKLHAIGRLDADTTGLLLLTNDGQLVHHVTNPNASSSQENKLVKVYDALIMGYHTLDGDNEHNDNDGDNDTTSSTSTQLRKLLNGVDIGKKYGGMTQPPHELRVLGHPSPKSTLVRIAISEGKNRQVRRMFHAINSGVMKLHRVSIGSIDLGMLQQFHDDDSSEEGQWRLLTDKEISNGLGWKVRQLDDGHRETIGNARKRLRKRSRSAYKN